MTRKIGHEDLIRWKDEGGKSHAISVDAIMGFNDERTAEATMHAVEKGASITDHVILNPAQIELEILQSQTPLVDEDGFKRRPLKLQIRKSEFNPGGALLITRAVGSAVSSLFGANADDISPEAIQADAPVDRVERLFVALLSLLQARRTFSISYDGRNYNGFVLTSLTKTKEQGRAGAAIFKLSAVQITTVENANVKLPSPATFSLKPKGKKGTKTAEDLEKDLTKKKSAIKSLLAAGLDAF